MLVDGVYRGRLSSPAYTGDVSVTVEEGGLTLRWTGGVRAVDYARLFRFTLQNYCLDLFLMSGEHLYLDQLGEAVHSLYHTLWNAYNARVLKALFVEGEPLMECSGEYSFADALGADRGTARIRLYDDCLVLLPPGFYGRRIPLLFVREWSLQNYRFTFTLDSGEQYLLLRLGGDTDPLFQRLSAAVSQLRARAAAAAKALCPTLDDAQAAAVGRLVPDGVAAPLAQLAAVSPAFHAALQTRIEQAGGDAALRHFARLGTVSAGLRPARNAAEAPMLWLVTLGRQAAAVEFLVGEGESAATYVYRFQGEPAVFFRNLNHAMEAVSFRREVIYLPEAELGRPENSTYVMTIQRSGAVRFLRGCLDGRVIHRSEESWAAGLEQRMH